LPASILAIAGILACSSSDSTSTGVKPTTGVACKPATGGTTITLGSMQTTTVDCSQGGTLFELAGGGASYLLVPEFATGNLPIKSASYSFGSPNATAAQVLAAAPLSNRAVSLASTASIGAAPTRPGTRQQWFDARLRSADRKVWARGPSPLVHRSVATAGSPSAQVAPDVGSIRTFRVIATTDTNVTTTFKTVNARLAYVGTNILLYVDTLTAASGFATGDLSGIGDLFDKTLYPIDVNEFGQPSDIDQNGRLIMLMTPIVNALVTSDDCKKDGFIAGFFTGSTSRREAPTRTRARSSTPSLPTPPASRAARTRSLTSSWRYRRHSCTRCSISSTSRSTSSCITRARRKKAGSTRD